MFNPREIANIACQEEQMWWFRGTRRIAFSLLDPLFGGHGARRVFEGGCGTGFFASQVASRYGAAMFASDLIEDALAICGRRAGLRCVRSDVRSLPFADNSFDAALLMDVLIHLPRGEEVAALGETCRVLRSGGHLLVRCAAHEVFRSRHSEFIWEEQRFTKNGLRRSVELAGFAVRRATYANFLLSPLALLKFRVWEPLTRQAPATGLESLPAPLERLFYGALVIEDWLIRRGINLPAGQSLYLVAVKPGV